MSSLNINVGDAWVWQIIEKIAILQFSVHYNKSDILFVLINRNIRYSLSPHHLHSCYYDLSQTKIQLEQGTPDTRHLLSEKVELFLSLIDMHFYRPQRSCGQGNIFTPVCHSVHRGGFCLSAC